jgi:hypothetical protein
VNPASQAGALRVLVVGRSPGVLAETVELLRDKGYRADATNDFDNVLADYDIPALNYIVFGGMDPPDTKQHLREEIGRRNAAVTFVQGLAGIPGLIAAQVDALVGSRRGGGDQPQVAYDEASRTVRLTLDRPERVWINAWWGTSFVPPEPKSAALQVFDQTLAEGDHSIPLPDQIPHQASFIAVSVGGSVLVFTVGAMPQRVTGMVGTLGAPHAQYKSGTAE